MSTIFEDITLTWRGTEYSIPSNRVMPLIAKIEDVLTLQELAASQAQGKVKLSHIAQAYGTALRFAGAKVTDEEVYLGLFSGADQVITQQNTILGLLTLMTPPQLSKKAIKDAVANPQKAAVKSSPRRTRQRSRVGG